MQKSVFLALFLALSPLAVTEVVAATATSQVSSARPAGPLARIRARIAARRAAGLPVGPRARIAAFRARVQAARAANAAAQQ